MEGVQRTQVYTIGRTARAFRDQGIQADDEIFLTPREAPIEEAGTNPEETPAVVVRVASIVRWATGGFFRAVSRDEEQLRRLGESARQLLRLYAPLAALVLHNSPFSLGDLVELLRDLISY